MAEFHIKGLDRFAEHFEEHRLALQLDEAENAVNAGNYFTHEEVFNALHEKAKRLTSLGAAYSRIMTSNAQADTEELIDGPTAMQALREKYAEKEKP